MEISCAPHPRRRNPPAQQRREDLLSWGALLPRETSSPSTWTPPEILHPRRQLSVAQYEELLDDLSGYRGARAHARAIQDLHVIGSGASRVAYLLDVAGHPPLVLKVAQYEDDPYFQNATEVWCAAQIRSPLLPRIYAWGPSDEHVQWLVVEYLWPASAPDLIRLTGISARKLSAILDGPSRYTEARLRAAAEDAEPQAAAFLRQLGDLVEACDLAPGDIFKDVHWGIDAAGAFKLIDFGFRRMPARMEPPAHSSRKVEDP